MEPAEDGLGVVLLEDRPEIGAKPDGLAVHEMAPGEVLQGVMEGVFHAVHVAGVPAGIVERGTAPAMGQRQRPDPGVGHVVDLVETRHDSLELGSSLGNEPLVIRPSALLSA